MMLVWTRSESWLLVLVQEVRAGRGHASQVPAITPNEGHLALMLIRYLVDEKVLPLPGGLMLFSVSSPIPCSSNARLTHTIALGRHE